MEVKWRDDNKITQAAVFTALLLFGLSLIGSILTLLAINVLFPVDIPINFATVFSVAWLKMVIHAFFKSSRSG